MKGKRPYKTIKRSTESDLLPPSKLEGVGAPTRLDITAYILQRAYELEHSKQVPLHLISTIISNEVRSMGYDFSRVRKVLPVKYKNPHFQHHK